MIEENRSNKEYENSYFFLAVPFKDKDRAKALGAKWSKEDSCWYVPEGISRELFEEWMPNIYLTPRYKLPLRVELVPSSCWFSNVRDHLSQSDWDKVRKPLFESKGQRCQICCQVGSKHPVECHEVWQYDDENLIQTLTGLLCLCPMCHLCHHFGLAIKINQFDDALDHFQIINKITEESAKTIVKHAFGVWKERSAHSWTLDLSWITNKYDVKVINDERIVLNNSLVGLTN